VTTLRTSRIESIGSQQAWQSVAEAPFERTWAAKKIVSTLHVPGDMRAAK